MNYWNRIFTVAVLVAMIILPSACGNSSSATPFATATATLSVAAQPQEAANGPMLVEQIPQAGQRLDVGTAITLVFDRDMDAKKTSAAWSFRKADGEEVSGSAAWTDSRTFQFKPERILDFASDYLGIFSKTAADAQGNPLPADLQIHFRTVDALAAGQVFPPDGSKDVDTSTNITVSFNRPVVSLQAVDSSSLPQPLFFSPPLAGTGQWVNSSMYIFQPEGTLKSGTEYKVKLAEGLSDVTGNGMASPFSWRFATKATSGYLLSGDYDHVLLNQTLIVRFAQPMDTASVERATSLARIKAGQPIPLLWKWTSNDTFAYIQPASLLGISASYHFEITKQAKAKDGQLLENFIRQDFTTIPFPYVESVSPAPGSQQKTFSGYLTVKFSSPMNLDSTKNRVIFSPQPETLTSYYNASQHQLVFSGLDPATEYSVRVLPGMTDIYGNAVQNEFSFHFQTAALSPYARLLMPNTPLVYRADESQFLFFESINLDSADIQIYPITFEEFSTLMKPKSDAAAFQPQSASVRRWNPDVSGVKNRLSRIKLDFQADGKGALPPGYYFIGMKSSAHPTDSGFAQGAAFIVATDSLTLKTSPTESLVWLVDLHTGQPTPNVPVVIYDSTFQVIARGETDSDGLYYAGGLTKPYYARTDDKTRLAFAAQNWGSGVSAYQFGIWANFYSDTVTKFAYAYTERPLYRPGQDVNISGIVRQDDDLHYSLLPQPDVYVTVDQENNVVFAQTMPLSDLGTFTGLFHLDDNAVLGTYSVKVYDRQGDSQPVGGVSFRVAEYHKPEFQVLASAAPANVLVGDPFRFAAQADYYSGGKVGRAQVSWRLESSPFDFLPDDLYQSYSFSDWDRDSYWSDPTARMPATIDSGTGLTDDSGNFAIDRIASLGKTNASQQVRFFANLTDVAGNVVSVHSDAVVHQSTAYIGIRAGQYIGTLGRPQDFSLVALDWNSKPVGGLNASVDIFQRQWYSVQKQDAKGEVSWETSVKDVPAAHFNRVAIDDSGKGSVTFTPKAGGIYKVVATLRDSKNHAQHSSTFLWVSGGEYVPWRQTNDRSFNLVTDKDSYAPGDTADLLVAQPFSGPVYALVTVERGHVYRREVIRLDGNSTIYHLPITAEMAPASYVSVTVIRGAGSDGTPDFKVGMARLNVNTEQQKLNVSIQTDKTAAGPGDSVTYTVQVKDPSGKPVAADLSFALVDKAVLALAPSNLTPLLEAFYPVRSLSVATAVGLVASADDFNTNYKETPPGGEHSGSGGGGEKGVGNDGIVTVREYFRDTAYYRAQVRTDTEGAAQVTVVLPENLTTWQMNVRAVTADALVGEATHELVSSKPMFLQLQTPRFFVSGDFATIGASVFNNGAVPLDIDVSLDANGLQIESLPQQKVTVAAQSQAYVTWDVRTIPGATRADLTAHAASGSQEDSSKPPLGTLSDQGIPIYAFHSHQTVGTSGIIGQADSRTEAVRLPPAGSYDGALLGLDLAPSLAASLKNGFQTLEEFPYECTEQTASRLLAEAIHRRILAMAGNADSKTQDELDRQIGNTLQHLYGLQNYDGGWGWWGGDSDAQTTAFVVFALSEANRRGISVSSEIRSGGVGYLQRNMPAIDKNTQPWEYNQLAFLAYVIAEAGAKDDDAAFAAYDSRDNLAVFAKAYLAQAIADLNPNDTRINTLRSDLASAAVSSAAGTHWEEKSNDPWSWNSDLRTTAIVLNAMIRMNPDSANPIAANAVRWLMAAHKDGGWGSTQDDVWTMLALTNWLDLTKEFQPDYSYAVGWNNAPLQTGTMDSSKVSDLIHLEVGQAQMRADQNNFLVISRSAGAGNLYYTLYLDLTVPAAKIQPLDQGIIVSRQYFRLDDDKTPVTVVRRGELVQVRVTVNAPASLHFVVVNDALPAGLEPVDASLLTDMQVPSNYTYADYWKRGWGWWFFDHIERHDEKVELSASYLPTGAYVYTYYARASTVGTFQVLPVAAEEFYFPDVSGRGAGSVFTVQP